MINKMQKLLLQKDSRQDVFSLSNRQRAHPLRAHPYKRVTLIMVGVFTTEATIKSKHFRREELILMEKHTRFGQRSLMAKQLLHGAKGRISDGPTMTTTIFEFISLCPIFHFWGPPGCRPKCPFYTMEHRENTKILHLMCHQMPF